MGTQLGREIKGSQESSTYLSRTPSSGWVKGRVRSFSGGWKPVGNELPRARGTETRENQRPEFQGQSVTSKAILSGFGFPISEMSP